jgi:CBS domain-containing protein
MLNRLFKKNIEDFKAKDLMTKAVITAVPLDNLLVVQNLMSRFRIKKIVIVDSNNKRYPVGIVTIKDIIKFLISVQTDRELHEIPVEEAMTKSLTTTDKSTSVVDCAEIMLGRGNAISSLIVVEEGSWEQIELAGILTSTDFTRFFSENCRGLASVKDYMSESVLTISINEKVSKAAELMAEKNVSRLVVVATNNYSDGLSGILTETDISRVILAIRSKTLRSVYEYLQIIFSSSKRNNQDKYLEPTLIRIRDVYTPNPYVIDEDADLAEAAKIMVRQGISGLPVIEPSLEKKKTKTLPVGIISKTDLIKALRDLK